MKAYETLELEIIKFEAQDVITSSAVIDTPVEDAPVVDAPVVDAPVVDDQAAAIDKYLSSLPADVQEQMMSAKEWMLLPDGTIIIDGESIYKPEVDMNLYEVPAE